LFLEKRSREHC